MNLREGYRQKSLESQIKSETLRARQKQHSSSEDVDLEVASHMHETPKAYGLTSRIDEQQAWQHKQMGSELKDVGSNGELPRSTSPLNVHRLTSPRLVKHEDSETMAMPTDGRNEEHAGNGGSAGLLRLSGRQGWTASSWHVGSPKPQTVFPEATGPIQFTPQAVGRRDGQHLSSSHPMPSTPRSMPESSEQVPSVTHMGTGKSRMMTTQTPPEVSQGSSGANANLSKEWINMELERLKSEFQFKSQIATMLRSTLAGMKTQQPGTPVPPASQGMMPQSPKLLQPDGHQRRSADQDSVHQCSISQHSPVNQASSGELEAMKSEAHERKKDISELESDIAALEAHVKLLSDALDDERQDNQDLSEENVILKAQVEKLTTAGEKLLRGMTMMRGTQEP